LGDELSNYTPHPAVIRNIPNRDSLFIVNSRDRESKMGMGFESMGSDHSISQNKHVSA
jgi:hypothetical protein